MTGYNIMPGQATPGTNSPKSKRLRWLRRVKELSAVTIRTLAQLYHGGGVLNSAIKCLAPAEGEGELVRVCRCVRRRPPPRSPLPHP